MPSTITTYYSFSPGTKAKSSQVNTNFSNYRGDLLPINDNTASSSDSTHYLGSADHRWAGLYADQVQLTSSTSTTDLVFRGQTSNTTGAFEWLIEGSTICVMDANSLRLKGSTSTVDPIFEISQSDTTGSMDLLFGANTIAVFDSGGIQRRSLDVGYYTTGTSPVGSYVLTSYIAGSYGSGSTTGNTVAVFRLTTRGGGLVRLQVTGDYVGGIAALDLYRGSTTTSLSLIKQFFLPSTTKRDLTFNFYDSGYSSGEVVYQTIIKDNGSGPGTITAAYFVEEI